MFSRRILTISAFLLVVSGYLYFFEHLPVFIWFVGFFLVLLMCAYVFQHQLNWMWYKRFPPGLAEEIKAMYTHSGTFYPGLLEGERKKFDARVSLFVEAKEFIAQGIDEVPEDVRFMIAYYAVLLTFYSEQFLFSPYNRVVLYLHPFLTPHFPDQIHTYELEHEDGTVIFSMEQLIAGYTNPRKYYQTGLHAFAELLCRQGNKNPALPENDAYWSVVEETTSWSHQQIEDFTGMPQSDARPVLVHCFFSHPSELRKIHPDIYNAIADWLSWPRK